VQLPALSVGLVNHQRAASRAWSHQWVGPHRWPTWVIDWHDRPGRSIRVNGQGEHVRPARSWYIYPPETAYEERDDSARAGSLQRDHLWFFFTLAKPWPLLAGRAFSVIVDDDEVLAPHIQAMHGHQARGEPEHALAVHGHALAVLGEVLIAARSGAGTPEDPWRIRSARARTASLLQLVDREALRNLRRPPDLAALAERLGLSTSTLCHRFKAETGMTVMARLRWLRIREARTLLAQPDATVKETAWRLGYSSPFHLSQQFHAITGMTAANYMRMQR
jgi:AraC-like DNA-binding protein